MPSVEPFKVVVDGVYRFTVDFETIWHGERVYHMAERPGELFSAARCKRLDAKCERCESATALFDGTMCRACQDSTDAENAKAERVRNVLDAVEAFIDAKVAYERLRASDPEWANLCDVNETREHLADKLAEVLT